MLDCLTAAQQGKSDPTPRKLHHLPNFMPVQPDRDARRLQAWARQRAQEAGLPRPRAVHAVSSMRDTGVRDLLASLHRAAGGRGDVWVVRRATCLALCLTADLRNLVRMQSSVA